MWTPASQLLQLRKRLVGRLVADPPWRIDDLGQITAIEEGRVFLVPLVAAAVVLRIEADTGDVARGRIARPQDGFGEEGRADALGIGQLGAQAIEDRRLVALGVEVLLDRLFLFGDE